MRQLLVGAVLFGLAGCGSGRPAVSGTVIFQGQPLDRGVIQFFAKDGPPGPSGGAMILDGRYALTWDHGLGPGIYTVRITSALPPKGGSKMGEFSVTEERIPAEFNTKSVHVVEVTGSGNHIFDFSIP